MNESILNKVLGVSLIICLLYSCSGNQQEGMKYVAPVFKKQLNVKAKTLNDDFIFDIGRIHLMDTFLICPGKTDINNNCFHIFSKRSGDYIKSFGDIGQGPGEISSIIRGFCVDDKNMMVYVFDLGQNKYVSFSINDVLNNELYAEDIYFPYLLDNILSYNFLYLNNEEFLVGYSRLNRFVKTSLEDTIATTNIYPELDEPRDYKKVEEAYFFYLGCMAAKPDGKKIVHATRGGCILEILDCSGNKIQPLQTKRFFKPVYDSSHRNANYPYVSKSDDAVNGIVSISCTNKYIYANYSDNKGENAFNQIAVFDWDGNPVKMLSFEDRVISAVFEEDNHTGYALVWDSDDDVNLITFKIESL